MHGGGQVVPHLVRSVGAVQQKDGPWRGHRQHIHPVQERELMARDELRFAVGVHRELAAREPLAGVVVGVALESQRDPPGHERAEAQLG